MSGDHYSPGRRRSPLSRRDRTPPPAFTGDRFSSVHDRDFTFEQQPHRFDQDRDSYRPSYRQSSPLRKRNRGGGAAGGRAPWNPFVPPPAHDRAILNFNFRDKTPELMPGMTTGGFVVDTVGEEVVEDEEAKMEMSDDDTPAAVTEEKDDPVAPMGIVEGKELIEAEKKKIDVIAMIRRAKAKAAEGKEAPRDKVADNDDFISFDFGDEKKQEEEEDDDDRYGKKRRLNDGREDGRPFSHRENLHGPYIPKGPVDNGPPGVAGYNAGGVPPPPGLYPGSEKPPKRKRKSKDAYHSEDDSGITRTSSEDERADDGRDVPRKRKRKHSEISKTDGGRNSSDGNVIPAYRVRDDETDSTPWCTESRMDHSKSLDVINWLHKEIVDFISYIQPQHYEHAVRLDLIHRIRNLVRNFWSDTDVRVFGSFAADLYLPNSDMDLVVISETYARRGIPKYGISGHLHKLAGELRRKGYVQHGTLQAITKAKVPIVKFVDAATNLHVDISFDNESGLIANQTFNNWKKKYPAMPIIVTIIKHFLAMRNLNEVYHGGVGSFSITCLTVSMMQLLPSLASGKVDSMQHLGLVLMEFLELYGNRFDTYNVGIRVDDVEPGYFPKYGVFPRSSLPKNFQEFLLCIQDPNNPQNDISRSSYQIRTVLQTFSEAYYSLTERMKHMDTSDFETRKGRSLLGVILGGSYRMIEEQRERMKKVYVERIGLPEDLVPLKGIPPPPPPLPLEPPPPPPPPPSTRQLLQHPLPKKGKGYPNGDRRVTGITNIKLGNGGRNHNNGPSRPKQGKAPNRNNGRGTRIHPISLE